jgi:hypothetical protein
MTTKQRVLASYRALLQAAQRLPTLNRRRYVVKRVRMDYRDNKGLSDAAAIEFALQFAEVSLDNVKSQASTLSSGALFAPWSK